MDAERLAFRDGAFDALLCGFTIFLMSDLTGVLAEFARVLRPGGRVGISRAVRGDERWRWYDDLLLAYHSDHGIPLAPATDPGPRDPEALAGALRAAGFGQARAAIEEAEFVGADREEWWAAKWTHGARYPLERMPPPVLEQFRREAFAHLPALEEADGFHEQWSVAFVTAAR